MVNRMRSTRSHTGNRRSHHALKGGAFMMCKECGSPKLKHAACETCGKYKGRVVVDMVSVIAKKTKKAKAKETAGAAK